MIPPGLKREKFPASDLREFSEWMREIFDFADIAELGKRTADDIGGFIREASDFGFTLRH